MKKENGVSVGYELVKCCFCGAEIPDVLSNNPSPANIKEGERCCARCNEDIVIPSRIFIIDRIRESLDKRAAN